MDYFFTRHSYPSLTTNNGISFSGCVTDSFGNPHYIELDYNQDLSLIIQESNGKFLNISSREHQISFTGQLLVESPYLNKNKNNNKKKLSFVEKYSDLRKDTRYRCCSLLVEVPFGQLFIFLDLSKISIEYNTNDRIIPF